MKNDNFTNTEQLIANIWQDLLAIDKIERDTDFFDIGGNSLNAITFLSRLEKNLGKNVLSADTLFANGELNVISASIDNTLTNQQKAS